MKPEKQLYQWDVNQYLTGINPAAQYVDYTIGNEVIRLETDGTRCRIPDEVMQTYGGKTCYERYPDGTYRAYSFTVLYAPKPPGYAFTPEERTTFEALTARVDASIEEIKRRADSGEFTPKKGVDYFTNAEKAEMMESVSDGAIGEFRNVVDSATTEYNDNHAEKLAEYNANAETKTAEFDANAAALQTEVDRLRGECDNLAAENRKQENRISALMKMNKGQTYDIVPEEGESASRTAPSGAKYVSVDKVGGKSIVWNQLYNVHKSGIRDGFKIVSDGQTITMIGNSGSNVWISFTPAIGEFTALNARNHRYLYSIFVVENSSTEKIVFGFLNRPNFSATIPANYTGKVNFVDTVTNPDAGRTIGFKILQPNTDYNVRIVVSGYDLTLMFGAGNEPTAEQFERMFPADSYPYNPGEIISSRTDTITAGAESITTGFPELRSAGTVHDAIDMDGGEIRRNVWTVDLGTLDWTYNSDYKFMTVAVDGKRAGHNNLIMSRYNLSPSRVWQQDSDGVYGGNEKNNTIYIKDLNYSDPAAFKVAISGVMLHYELETPTTESVTIPEALQEWLPVEAGGTVAFRNSDESKQLAVPNAVSWVRKLNEVE